MTTLVLELMQSIRLRALALIPIIAGIYWYLANRVSRLQPPSSRLRFAIPKGMAQKCHGVVLLALFNLASLVIIQAIPRDYGKQARDRAITVVTIDVSWSMGADDMSPNRLGATKGSVKKLIASLPERSNVILVTFTRTASVNVPSTMDREVLNRATDNIQMAPSTAIGEAIYTGLDALELVPPDPDHPDATVPVAIVLFSDSASSLGRDSAAATQQSKQLEIPIYIIACGTQNGYVESSGRREWAAVDHHKPYVAAENFGGRKFSTESTGELSEIYQTISSDLNCELVPMEITNQYVGLAIIFAVLAATGVTFLRARQP